jgi:hypothetical protein
MSLLNLLVKIGTDILTKPNSNAAQVTQYILKNPEVVRDGAELIGEAYKGLVSIWVQNLNRNSAKITAQKCYNDRNQRFSADQKRAFSNLAKQHLKNGTHSSMGLFACEEEGNVYVGAEQNGNVLNARKINYNTIDPSFKRELYQKKVLKLN